MLLRTSVVFNLIFILCFLYKTPYAYTNNIHVGIFLYSADDSFVVLVSKYIKEHLAHSAKVSVFDAAESHDLQMEQIEKAMEMGVNAIALNPVDVRKGQSLLTPIQANNLPVVFFNREPNLEALKKYSLAKYVGTSEQQAGKLQGQIISELWRNNPSMDRNNDGICQFIMLKGDLSNPATKARSKYSVSTAQDNDIKMQQLGYALPCRWNEEYATKITMLALNKYIDNVDLIIANNDAMALGAIKALQRYGFNLEDGEKSIQVVGIDAIEKARDAIHKGIMHGTVTQNTEEVGKVITTMLINAVNKKHFLDGLPYSYGKEKIDVRIPHEIYQ